ncbi:MAG: Kdo2-lipid lauroyltransferase/acyltransferase, partial [Gemmatimonadaceae bacterium]|nr:Kdo2-lipid lauroyltransferase/acyltransferase [Gemmatimonadaceae bacterium]
MTSPATKERVVKKPTLAHRAEYYTMRATIAALRALSWDAACKVGERLGALGYRPLGIRKRVVERQIAAAFPDLSPEAVVNLARESYEHLGRTFVETALLDSIGKDGLQKLVESVEGWEEIEEVMSKGRGAVLV